MCQGLKRAGAGLAGGLAGRGQSRPGCCAALDCVLVSPVVKGPTVFVPTRTTGLFRKGSRSMRTRVGLKGAETASRSAGSFTGLVLGVRPVDYGRAHAGAAARRTPRKRCAP